MFDLFIYNLEKMFLKSGVDSVLKNCAENADTLFVQFILERLAYLVY